MDPYTPFCGTPPLPTDLLTRWTLDPVLLTGLVLAGVLGLRLAQDRRRMTLAWGIVVVLFVSPLCAASMALFSARVAQHILLTLLAAPLLAAALPRVRVPAMPPALLFAALFWLWHAPEPYQATLESDLAYWTMHLSLFGSATLLFMALRARPERSIAAAALTAAQMTLFAAILTLSPNVWHGWHEITTLPYGLSALADQQLAGGVMWVAGGALFLTIVGRLALRFMKEAETPRGRGAHVPKTQ